MEGILGIFKSIISLDSDICDVYLGALEEHQSFFAKGHGDGNEVAQTISSLLAKRDSRPLGLLLLNQFVGQCVSIDVLEQKANLWTTLALKATSSVSELSPQAELVYNTLLKLAEKAQTSPDLTKTFASNHLGKIYESLGNVSDSGHLAALRCVEHCLNLYPGPSGPAKSAIERYLVRFIDTTDEQLSKSVGKCQHLLQQVRSGQGINHKTQWQNYQLQLLTSLHALLDEAFSKCSELYDEHTSLTGDQLDVPALELSDEPVRRAAQLYLRFRNLMGYLQVALSEPFPVEKPVMPKKILNLINRGLSMTCTILQPNAISDNLALGALLPNMHCHLLQVLKALMLTLRSHLRVHHELILGLLADTLKWTSSKQSIGVKKPLANLRAKTYELISLWCSIMQSGSRCEMITEQLIPEIIYDVYPYQAEFTLKVMSGARKHMSKKARRQFHKTQNEQSNLAQAHANNPIRKEALSDEGNQSLCIAALRCLNDVLLSTAHFIKPTVMKTLHNNILKICGLFYEFPLRRQHLYSNWKCRVEIYDCLYVLLMTPHQLCPPPTQMAINVLQTANMRDGNLQVRQKCSTLLLSLEKLIHPQKEGLLYPIEARDIRNTFIALGKERLLNSSFIKGASFVTEENYESDDDEEDAATNVDSVVENTAIEPSVEKEQNIADHEEEGMRSGKPEEGDQHTAEHEEEGQHTAECIAAADHEHSKDISIIDLREDDESNAVYSESVVEKNTKSAVVPFIDLSQSIEEKGQFVDITDTNSENENSNDVEEILLAAPSPKKLRLDITDSGSQATKTAIQESAAPVSNVELNDDMLVADIEAAFVDELN